MSAREPSSTGTSESKDQNTVDTQDDTGLVENSGILSRRSLLRVLPAGFLAGTACSALDGCAFGGGQRSPRRHDTAPSNPSNPLGVTGDATLNVVIFNGGYTDKYAVDVHEPLYRGRFPRARIEHEVTAEIGKTVRPRLIAGRPPDVVNNSGSDLMDFGALASAGQLLDLTAMWDAPSVDDPSRTVRETVIPGTVASGAFDGRPYVLFYVSTVYGLWHSGTLFADRGWTAPNDWDEFMRLLSRIKAAGIAPYAYGAANAAYYQWNVILTQAAKIGGKQILTAIDNLEDDAWRAGPVKQAAAMWAEVGARYLDAKFQGLSHTQVQLLHNQYQVAFYPCGSWLENEQRKSTPPEFRYSMTPLPGSRGDKMPATTVRASASEGFFVPAQAQNTRGGLEYLRQMLSMRGATGFADLVGSPTVVADASSKTKFPLGTRSALDAVKTAGANVVNMSFGADYKPLETEVRAATNELMFGRADAGAFVDRIQRRADAIKRDPSIAKFKR